MLFFKSEDTEVSKVKADINKLFASNEKQTDNRTLVLDMLHSNMSVVCTYVMKSPEINRTLIYHNAIA